MEDVLQSTFLVNLHSKTFIFVLVFFVVSWDQLNLGSDLKLDWHERNLQCRSKSLMRDPELWLSLWEMRLFLIMSLFMKKERDNSVIEIQL